MQESKTYAEVVGITDDNIRLELIKLSNKRITNYTIITDIVKIFGEHTPAEIRYLLTTLYNKLNFINLYINYLKLIFFIYILNT